MNERDYSSKFYRNKFNCVLLDSRVVGGGEQWIEMDTTEKVCELGI